MLKVNVLPRKTTRKRSTVWDAKQERNTMWYIILFCVAALAGLLYWRSTLKGADEFKQECFEQGGSEAIETSSGQVLCLKGSTIVWRK